MTFDEKVRWLEQHGYKRTFDGELTTAFATMKSFTVEQINEMTIEQIVADNNNFWRESITEMVGFIGGVSE